MTLNPITALSEQLQKFINEHGSAAILRDHLALFKDQLIVLEKKTPILENTIKTLESQLQNATKEIERQKQIIEASQGSQNAKKYNEITEKIMKLFFDEGKELPINYVATFSRLNINTARYHCDILLKDNLIKQTKYGTDSSWMGENTTDMYDLTRAGRKHVVEHKDS